MHNWHSNSLVKVNCDVKIELFQFISDQPKIHKLNNFNSQFNSVGLELDPSGLCKGIDKINKYPPIPISFNWWVIKFFFLSIKEKNTLSLWLILTLSPLVLACPSLIDLKIVNQSPVTVTTTPSFPYNKPTLNYINHHHFLIPCPRSKWIRLSIANPRYA